MSNSPRFPSFRLSLEANSSNSRRRSWRTRIEICAFHSPNQVLPNQFKRNLSSIASRKIARAITTVSNHGWSRPARLISHQLVGGELNEPHRRRWFLQEGPACGGCTMVLSLQKEHVQDGLLWLERSLGKHRRPTRPFRGIGVQ